MNKVRNISINVEYSKIYPYFLRIDLAQSHIWAKQIIFKKVNSDVYNVTLNGVRNYPCLLSFFSSYGIGKEQMIITIV